MSKKFPDIKKFPAIDSEGYYMGMVECFISPLQADEGIYNYPPEVEAALVDGKAIDAPKATKKNQRAKLVEGVWVLEDIPVESIEQKTEEVVKEVIEQDPAIIAINLRNKLLRDSDYITLMAYERGIKVSREWVIYRQMLRDLTDQSGFPNNIQWPVKPE